MPSSGPAPTLSAIRGWDTTHLTEAATHWTTTAAHWEDTFTQLFQSVSNPGGRPWFGDAADAAQQRAYADRITAIGASDQLHEASAAARTGADQICAAKQAALAAVQRAELAGFIVEEDFSLRSRETGSAAVMAARQAEARAADGALIEQTILVVDQAHAALSTELATLTDDLTIALVKSIDRATGPGRAYGRILATGDPAHDLGKSTPSRTPPADNRLAKP